MYIMKKVVVENNTPYRIVTWDGFNPKLANVNVSMGMETFKTKTTYYQYHVVHHYVPRSNLRKTYRQSDDIFSSTITSAATTIFDLNSQLSKIQDRRLFLY